MKDKLTNLESRGINPTRDHVINHLDAIRDLTFGKNYLTYVWYQNENEMVFGLSQLQGSTDSNKEYFRKSSLLNSTKVLLIIAVLSRNFFYTS